MVDRLRSLFGGQGLRARALRGVSVSVVSFGGQNALRLLSTLVLTRLLFPEAFGLMAIVGVFTTGLQMFSDLGIKASIIQSKRGDDRDFLNTAWTLQIIRGLVLAMGCAALGYPASLIYNEPMLFPLLVAMGLSPLASGFVTTNLATARRNIHLIRQSIVQLVSQALGIVVMVILAYLYQSVWALALGSLFSVVLRVLLYQIYLPGLRNSLRWEPAAVSEIFGFGKFVFLSTLASFLINQSDKAVLGAYVTIGLLGVYNIGFTLGILPLMLLRVVTGSVIFPLYRMRPPAESESNQKHIFRVRRLLIGTILVANAFLSLIGVPLVEVLYDPRYVLAGSVIVLMGFAIVPQIVFVGYANALMAHGDTKRMFHLQATTAVLQVSLLFIGITYYGLAGAILVPGLAALCTYPLLTRLVAKYKALDMKGDAVFLGLGFAANGAILWHNWDAVADLIS
jgi:O-antigen/teichoic acid export membrane protein